jgi:hypothetical protein
MICSAVYKIIGTCISARCLSVADEYIAAMSGMPSACVFAGAQKQIAIVSFASVFRNKKGESRVIACGG